MPEERLAQARADMSWLRAERSRCASGCGSSQVSRSPCPCSSRPVRCGAIATAYPFFLVSLFTVRCLYPSLLPYGRAGSGDASRLRTLQRRSVGFLTVAASIPLIAVGGLTFVPTENIPNIIEVVRVVCVGGILAFVASYSIFRLLEGDLNALLRVVSRRSR